MNVMEPIHEVVTQESHNLLEAYDSLEKDSVEQVVGLIKDCRGKIILSACGTSAMAARKITHTLNVVGRPALFLNPADASHGGLGVLQPQDIMILISKGGETGELLPIEKVARVKQIKTVVVTENRESQLARQSDCVLFVKVQKEPDQFNMMATGSTLAVISVFDAICILISKEEGYTKEDLALIHPGGAVGKRLCGLE